MTTISESSQAKLRWRQFSLRGLLLVVLAVALIFGWLQPARLDRGFFPIAVGYKWVYEDKFIQTNISMGKKQIGDDVVFEVLGKAKVGDDECFVVLRTIGEHKLEFYVRVTDGGVWIHQVGEYRYRPPYRQFVFPSKKGDRWNWEGTIGQQPGQYASDNNGLQDVVVPFGQLSAFIVNQRAEEGGAEFWLAEGVGVVKIAGKTYDKHDYTIHPDGNPLSLDWELKEFSRP